MGPMGGPMDFGRNKSKFQEVPETGITFDDVAVRPHCLQLSLSASPSLRAHWFLWQVHPALPGSVVIPSFSLSTLSTCAASQS